MQSQNKNSHHGVFAAIGFVLSSPVTQALDLGYGDWQLHGFLSQGYTYTSGMTFSATAEARAVWISPSWG